LRTPSICSISCLICIANASSQRAGAGCRSDCKSAPHRPSYRDRTCEPQISERGIPSLVRREENSGSKQDRDTRDAGQQNGAQSHHPAPHSEPHPLTPFPRPYSTPGCIIPWEEPKVNRARLLFVPWRRIWYNSPKNQDAGPALAVAWLTERSEV
jgi:hypothetical protein